MLLELSLLEGRGGKCQCLIVEFELRPIYGVDVGFIVGIDVGDIVSRSVVGSFEGALLGVWVIDEVKGNTHGENDGDQYGIIFGLYIGMLVKCHSSIPLISILPSPHLILYVEEPPCKQIQTYRAGVSLKSNVLSALLLNGSNIKNFHFPLVLLGMLCDVIACS